VQEAMRRAVARERQEAARERLRGQVAVTSPDREALVTRGCQRARGRGRGRGRERRRLRTRALGTESASEGDRETQTPVTNFVERGTAAQLAQAEEASPAPSTPRARPRPCSRP